MYHAVCGVLNVVFTATCPKVSVRVPVSLQVAINGRGHGVASNVELPALIKERLLNILLDDVAASVTVNLLCLDERSDVIKVTADLDSTATIRVLTGLDDPE